MGISLKDKKILVIGRPSGIAGAVTLAVREQGAQVIVAGRDQGKLERAYDSDIAAEKVDVTDDRSIEALADRLGSIDHLVTTASARARGLLQDLDRDALRQSFDTKVIGPVMLAKHFAPRINDGGTFTLFSGVAASKPAIGFLGVAITNGAADFLTRSPERRPWRKAC
ncbi:SDR family oxidoreductase [Kibdelosporangium philippinense]|uniref:SDR family oxidoreductase n=1 Tax=Kibdelosporangium philippinense TaxID=211113 RepID=A0ABS8ZTC4_9PSEU|nr:SDR family oxidoreductase [Kibdelosporangium philippinense]MCE7010852.1 SDR family oxidoreductase [Kibdelosporangium philippinense]